MCFFCGFCTSRGKTEEQKVTIPLKFGYNFTTDGCGVDLSGEHAQVISKKKPGNRVFWVVKHFHESVGDQTEHCLKLSLMAQTRKSEKFDAVDLKMVALTPLKSCNSVCCISRESLLLMVNSARHPLPLDIYYSATCCFLHVAYWQCFHDGLVPGNSYIPCLSFPLFFFNAETQKIPLTA